jgi:hypothetical protein
MAKQTKKQETTIEENLIEEQIVPVEEIETVIEEVIVDNTPEVIETIIEEKNTNKVRKIIQKRPSHYSLLMEDGRQVIVKKALFDKSTMTIK